MGTLVKLPMSELQRLALVWQEEQRAFDTVLEVLKTSRRFDLVLKVDTFNKVRRRRIMNLLFVELRKQKEAGGRSSPVRRRDRTAQVEDGTRERGPDH